MRFPVTRLNRCDKQAMVQDRELRSRSQNTALGVAPVTHTERHHYCPTTGTPYRRPGIDATASARFASRVAALDRSSEYAGLISLDFPHTSAVESLQFHDRLSWGL